MAENMEAQELWQHRRQERGGGPAGVPTLTRWAPTCSLRRNRRCPHRQLLRRPGAFAVVTTDWKRQKLLSWETGRPGCTRQGDPPHMKERGASMHFKSLSQTPPRWRTRKDKTNADGCECPLHWAWMWGWWEGHVGDPGWGQHWVWGPHRCIRPRSWACLRPRAFAVGQHDLYRKKRVSHPAGCLC